MKVVILAGGLGLRMGEDTERVPKPMIEIGGRPLLWHIMKLYSHYGFYEFIICLGYKGYVIKEYFANFRLHNAEFVRFFGMSPLWFGPIDWEVTLVETGLDSGTGTRLRKIRDWISRDEPFLLTYGDGLADVDISALVKFHEESGKLATVTAVRPPGRFGSLDIVDYSTVYSFTEKPQSEGRINGGFFVLEPGVFDYIPDSDVMWEQAPLEGLARDHELGAYLHDGFWQCMDTQRDRALLEELWKGGKAPWKVWE